MRLVLRLIVCWAVVGAAAAHAGSASAAISDVPRPPSGTYACLDATSVVLPAGRGTFSAGRVVETGQVFVPYAIAYSLSIDGELSILQTVTKSKIPAGASTCTVMSPYLDEVGNVIGQFVYSVSGVVQTKS